MDKLKITQIKKNFIFRNSWKFRGFKYYKNQMSLSKISSSDINYLDLIEKAALTGKIFSLIRVMRL